MRNRLSLPFLLAMLVLACAPAHALELVVDNTDSGFSFNGVWTTSTSNAYGGNLYWHAPGTGTNTATWTASPPAGWYRLDFYAGANTTWATDAYYTVTHRDGTTTLTANQRYSTADWHSLGTYYFDGTASIVLTDRYSGGSRVVADALRLQSIFSFVHMSDSHIGYTTGTVDAGLVAGELAALGKVAMEPFGFDAPPPSFAIHTGDVTEYGQEFWSLAMGIFAPIPYPVYMEIGNHDATQNSNREKLRARQGAPYYSFDHTDRGTRYHFVMVDSTILQSPRASFTRGALDWLAADLAALPANTPVFVAFHHPIDGAADPKPYDSYRLMEVLRRYNVVAVLYGHGHNFQSSYFDGLTLVQGGSTYDAPGGKRGYNLVTITQDRVHIAKKVYGEPTAATGILDGIEIPATASYPTISVSNPPREYIERGTGLSLNASISATGDTITGADYEIDGNGNWLPLAGTGNGPYTGTADLASLIHGRHWVRFRFNAAASGPWYKAVSFWAWDGFPRARWVFDLGASSLGAPAVAAGRVYAACNEGAVRCVDARYGAELWSTVLPGDIMSSPAVADGRVVLGCSDGKVYALDAETGAVDWATTASGPVYSSPSVSGNSVYIGCNGDGGTSTACLLSLDLASGAVNWRFPALCAIETKPCVLDGIVYFGAWDSYFYAVNTADGTEKWRYQRNANRYYSPADSWPAAASGRVFVSDRQYYLSAISTASGAADWTRTGAAAQCLTSGGTALIQRLTGGDLVLTDFSNNTGWSQTSATLDSAPVAPVSSGSRVAVVNQHGLATAANAASGAVEYQFQVGQGYQLGPCALDEDGNLFASNYDGYLVCVENQAPPALSVPEIILEPRDASGALTPNPPYEEQPSGSWSNSTAKSVAFGLTGSGSRFNLYTNTTSGTARMTPNFSMAGEYAVYAAWNTSSNANNVAYVVNHKDGVTTVTRDQKPAAAAGGSNCNVWNLLGKFNFSAGQDAARGSVTVDESTVTGPYNSYNTGRTYVDGWMWVYSGPFARIGEWREFD